MSLTFNEQSLTTVLFEMNNKSFDLCEHEAKNRDLNDYLLTRSLFAKITLNKNCERSSSCSSICIKIIFTMCLIMNKNRLIINLLLRLIVVFNFFYDKCNDFESEKNSSLKFESKSF